MNFSMTKYGLLVTPDDESNHYVATCVEIPGCHGAGQTQEEAMRNARRAIEDHVRWAAARGYPLPPPTKQVFSGRVLLRIPRSVHRLASQRAEREGVSLNQYISVVLGRSVTEGELLEEARQRCREACADALSDLHSTTDFLMDQRRHSNDHRPGGNGRRDQAR